MIHTKLKVSMYILIIFNSINPSEILKTYKKKPAEEVEKNQNPKVRVILAETFSFLLKTTLIRDEERDGTAANSCSCRGLEFGS